MPATLKAFALGALAASACCNRRQIQREWRWAKRDLADFRAEIAGYLKAHT